MAENTTIPDPTGDIAANSAQATSVVGTLIDQIKKLGEILLSFASQAPRIQNITNAFNQTNSAATDFFQTVQNIEDNINGSVLFNAALSLPITQGILGANNAFKDFAATGVKSSYQVSEAYTNSSKIILSALQAIGVKSNTADFITQMGANWYGASQAAREFENTVLRNAATSGDLGDVYKATGTDLRGLNDITASWREKLLATADATGVSLPQVNALAAAFSKIRGAMDATVPLAVGKSVDALTASIIIANGTQRDASDVITQQNEAYLKFGRSAGDALTVLTDVSATAKTMGLPLSIVENSIKGISEKFVDMGDNAESSIKIFQRFAPALQAANVSPEQIAATVNSIGAGIRSMTLAQKAFLSAQSGGPGGLAGAYKIENLIKQGNIADVAKMAEDALRKQFGGRILTLEDAQKSNASASEFTKQVKFLQSGAFGKLASSDQDAYRLLDALKKGSGFEQIGAKFGSSTDNMREALEVGTAEIKRNTDALTTFNNRFISGAQTSSSLALDQQRELNDKLSTQLDKIRTAGEETGRTTSVLGTVGRTRTAEEVNNDTLSKAKEAVGLGKDFASALFHNVMDGRDKVKEEIERAAKAPIAKSETPMVETARGTITAPAQAVFEANRQGGAKNEQPKDFKLAPIQVNAMIECPECHVKHLQKIVVDQINQSNKNDVGKAYTGMGNR